MGERLLCKQEVIGSNPFTSTTRWGERDPAASSPLRGSGKAGGPAQELAGARQVGYIAEKKLAPRFWRGAAAGKDPRPMLLVIVNKSQPRPASCGPRVLLWTVVRRVCPCA